MLRLIDVLIRGSTLKNIAFKTVRPILLLQKPSKDPKAKDRTKAPEMRLELWTLAELLKEGETMQSSLKHVDTLKNIAQLSKKFVEQMPKGHVDSAIKLTTNNMQNGILPLTDTILKLLKQKHPKSVPTNDKVLLPINLKVFTESNTKISMQMQFAKLH